MKPESERIEEEGLFEIEVTVISTRGNCTFGHKIGDKIYFDGRTIKGDICYDALLSLSCRLYAMRYGVNYSWAENKNVITAACPDSKNPVVFQIKRITNPKCLGR